MRVQISLTINQCNQLTGLRYPFHWYQEITGQNLQVFLTKRHTLYIALYSSFYISDLFLTITKYRGLLRSYVMYHGFLLDVMPVERLNIIKTKIDSTYVLVFSTEEEMALANPRTMEVVSKSWTLVPLL